MQMSTKTKISISCDDCGLPYDEFGLDTALPNNQWADICLDGNASLLCANCIVKRASKFHGAIAARMVIDYQPFALIQTRPTPADHEWARQVLEEMGE